jgi:hypothetical protein
MQTQKRIAVKRRKLDKTVECKNTNLSRIKKALIFSSI